MVRPRRSGKITITAFANDLGVVADDGGEVSAQAEISATCEGAASIEGPTAGRPGDVFEVVARFVCYFAGDYVVWGGDLPMKVISQGPVTIGTVQWLESRARVEVPPDWQDPDGIATVTAQRAGFSCKPRLDIRVGCGGCGSGNCAPGDSVEAKLDSMSLSFPLGHGKHGRDAGAIELRVENPSSSGRWPASREFLRVTAAGDYADSVGVVVARNADGLITDVNTPEVTVRISNLTTDPNETNYKLAFGGPAQGAPTFSEWSVEKIHGATDEFPDGFSFQFGARVTKSVGGGGVVYKYLCAYNASTFQWLWLLQTLRSSQKLREERLYRSADGLEETRERYEWDGGSSLVLVERVETDYVEYGWGREKVEERAFTGVTSSEALTTSYAYYEDALRPGERLKSVTLPDGSWRAYTYVRDLNANGDTLAVTT